MLFVFIMCEQGSIYEQKAKYGNTVDLHSKSMLCHPLVPESKHMLGSPNRGTFTLESQIPHM